MISPWKSLRGKAFHDVRVSHGLIVDYIGIVKALRKALADYTANVGGQGGADPTVDKNELIARILETITAAEQYLAGYGFSLQALVEAKD